MSVYPKDHLWGMALLLMILLEPLFVKVSIAISGETVIKHMLA